MKNKIMTMMMAALAFTACIEEDLMQPTYSEAGMLHITSVTIDGQDVARTRVVADDYTYDYSMSNLPYNQSFKMFTQGDALQLFMTNATLSTAYAICNADGTWSTSSNQGSITPVTIVPYKANSKTWADFSISQATFGGNQVLGTSYDNYLTATVLLDVVQGDIAKENSIIFSDLLVASTTDGSITIDTDVKSPTLGATTIKLKHAHALLRLPVSATNVTAGTYIVDGTAYDVTGLGTLWAVLSTNSTSVGEDGTETTTSTTTYCPLTAVKIGEADYLQAIVPSTSTDGAYSLTGFKAVMNTSEEGETLTLDLPFKVGESETHEADGIALTPNTRYPLTLTIAPHTSSVSLSSGLGKPGWGTEDDEDELSNELNEAVVIDGAATDVATVKADIEAGLAEGKRTIVVTGETLAAYSDGTAQTVVGEAISQLTEGTTVSLVLPDATGIAQNAFVQCTALTSVSAPEVLGILASAFGGCTSLASVELPKATTIMNVAFGDCTSLASVSLPAATSIGNSAFTNCTSLTSLTLGTVRNVVAADSFYNASTTNCDLTLGSGSTGNPEEGENKTWAGMTWKSITLAGSE